MSDKKKTVAEILARINKNVKTATECTNLCKDRLELIEQMHEHESIQPAPVPMLIAAGVTK